MEAPELLQEVGNYFAREEDLEEEVQAECGDGGASGWIEGRYSGLALRSSAVTRREELLLGSRSMGVEYEEEVELFDELESELTRKVSRQRSRSMKSAPVPSETKEEAPVDGGEEGSVPNGLFGEMDAEEMEAFREQQRLVPFHFLKIHQDPRYIRAVKKVKPDLFTAEGMEQYAKNSIDPSHIPLIGLVCTSYRAVRTAQQAGSNSFAQGT